MVDEKSGKKYSELTVSDFFNQVKSLKQDISDDILLAQIEVAERKLKKFKVTGQVEAARITHFYLQTFMKERKLLDMGVIQYVLATDINTYITAMKDKRDVAFSYLENYERDVPDEIVDKMERLEGMFDKYAVLYTDYTSKTNKKTEANRAPVVKERDPILFGMFGAWNENGECQYASPRMYVIGDWVDDTCDLTLSELLIEYGQKVDNPDIVHTVGEPDDEHEFIESIGEITTSNS